MTVSLPKETVLTYAELRLIQLANEFKQKGNTKTSEVFAKEVLEMLKGLNFDVIEDKEK
jgi:hypothetical protein